MVINDRQNTAFFRYSKKLKKSTEYRARTGNFNRKGTEENPKRMKSITMETRHENYLVLIIAVVLCSALLFAGENRTTDTDVESIKKVIEESSVRGIHNERDAQLIKKAFHPDFNMLMLRGDGTLEKPPISDWMASMERRRQSEPGSVKVKTDHTFETADVNGKAAVKKIALFRKGKQIYTDYMSLYKFPDGWKIVGKIYYSH